MCSVPAPKQSHSLTKKSVFSGECSSSQEASQFQLESENDSTPENPRAFQEFQVSEKCDDARKMTLIL